MANKWRSYLTGIDTEEEEKKKKEDGAGAPSSWADYLRSQIAGEEPEPEKPVIEAKKIEPEPLGGFETAKEKATGMFADRLGQTFGAERIRQREAEEAEKNAAGGKVSLFGGGEQAKSAATDLFRNRVLGTAGAEKEREKKEQAAAETAAPMRSAEEIRADLDEAKREYEESKKKSLRDEFFAWGGGIAGRTKTLEENDARNAELRGRIDSLEAEERRLVNAEKYAGLKNNPDFAAKSEARELTVKESVSDPLYAYINGDKTAAMMLTDPLDPLHSRDDLVAENMTTDEVRTYNYLHATEGKDAADEYLDFLRPDLNARTMERVKDEAYAWTGQNAGTQVLGSAASVALNALKGVSYGGQLEDMMTTGRVDVNAPYNQTGAISSAIRQNVTDTVERKWGKWGSFAYQTGMSMADFLFNAAISGGTEAMSLAIMGTGAAADATIAAKERGLGDTEAFILGSIAGAAEIASEKISFEKLFKNADLRQAPVKYVLQNFFFEGAEEVESDVVNWLADAIVARDKSEWRADMDAYRKEHPGASDTKAFWSAMLKRLEEGGMDFLGGALSGGVMAGGRVALNQTTQRAQQNRDRSQAIEAVRAANNEARQNAAPAPDLMKGIRKAQEQTAPVSPQEAAQTQAEPEGGIVLPTAETAAGEAEAGTEMRVGAEPETASPLKTAEESELDERVAKARNVTEATGIRYGVDERTIRKAERIGRMIGKTIQFYEQGSKNGTAENGFVNPRTGEIYYNVNAKQALNFTLGHEFTHTVEGTEAYENLHALVLGRLAEEGIDVSERRARVRDTYERAGIGGMTNTEIDQEIVADWVGDHLSDERTIREICREDASVGKRIRDTIDDFLVRAGQMQGVVTAYEERKLRNAIGIYDKYLRRIAAETGQETAQETQETPQSVQETGAGQTAAEAVRPAETQGTPVSERVRARMAEAKTAEPMGMADLEEGGEETPDEYLARMNRLYEDGEITAEEYDEAVELAEEMRDTGLGAGRTTVARDAGPEGKIPALIRNVRDRAAERQYSISVDEDESRKNAKTALEYFGKTYSWRETGYITRDGDRIDFSGKRDGAPAGHRSMDHREISDALGDDYGDGTYSGAMVQFMREGNIRISPESGGINLMAEPTEQQYKQLEAFIQNNRGEVILDIDDEDGYTIESREYDRGTRSSRVLNDIRGYFEDGALPEEPDIRYSVSEAEDEAYMKAVEDGDTETAQRMVDEAARNAGYNSPKLYHGTDYYKQINIFKPGKSGYLGPGIYLTPNESLAKRYADRSGDGGRIYSAWAKIQNPLNVTSDEPAREILREITGSDRVFNNRMARQAWSTQILTKADMNKLRAKGYDGIIWKYGTSPAEYMVFESSQIKSADPVTYDENNEPIKLSERFNDQDPDIRYSVSEAEDEAYMKAVEDGDTETAQRMVDEAAERAGYTVQKWHQTNVPNIHVFDLGIGTHGGTDSETPYGVFTKSTNRDIGLGDVQMRLYLKAGKTFTINNRKELRSKMPEVYELLARELEAVDAKYDSLVQEAEDALFEAQNAYEEKHPDVEISLDDIVNNRTYDDPDCQKANERWKAVMAEWREESDKIRVKAKGILTDYLKSNNYDSMEIKLDQGSNGRSTDTFIVLSPEQVKSADPVTYDDAGNVIPLSERFNDQDPDIRYSVSEAEDEAEQTKTSAFKRWFGDWQTDPENASKVVNEDGTPKVMYHGTNASRDFNLFNTYGSNYGLYGAGSYFTDNPEVASSYAENKGHGKAPRVYPVYLNIRNPIVMENDADVDAWLEAVPGIEDYITDGNNEITAVTNRDYYKAMEQVLEDEGLTRWEAAENAMDTLMAMGYDGIRHIGGMFRGEGMQHDVWIAFDPTQIKSATGNRGTFDPEDGDIRHSVSEEQDNGPIASLPQAKLRDAALRVENRLAANLADIFGVSKFSDVSHIRTTDEYKAFKADVVRPIINAMLTGQAVDEDAIFRERWSGSLTEGQNARADYDEAMADARQALGKLNVKSEEVRREAEAKALRNAEIDSQIPDTTEELVKMGQRFKDAKKRRAAVMSRIVLTEADQQIVDALASGRMTDEEAYARSPFGIDEILEAADAERQYRQAESVWSRYKSRLEERRIETADGVLENADKWKDKGSGIAYARETAERNFRDIAGEDAEQVIDTYLRPVHKAEAASTRFKNEYIRRVTDLGLSRKVGRGNAVSEAAAVQWLGEAEDNVRVLTRMRNKDAVRDGQTLDEWKSAIEQFKAKNPNLDYDKVRRGIAQFQEIYGELITEMNRVLVENGYEPVNIRSGYFPHFNGGDDGVLAKFAHLLGINIDSNALPTSINGLTSGFKPGKTWFGHAQERTGFHTDYDAVQGFEGYIGGVSDVIHQTANLRNLRTLASRIRYQMGDEGIKNRIRDIQANDTLTTQEKDVMIQDLTQNGKYKLSRAVAWLDEYTNLLANKKSKYDRGIEDLMGRRVYTWMKNIEGRVAANMIAGNLGSALTNFIPLNQAAAMIGDQNLIKGAAQTVANLIKGDDFVNRSDFLTNRRGTDPLIQNRADKIAEFLSAPMNLIDNFAAETIVRGAYNYYRKGGMDEESALDAANEFAAGVMADRSKGALPTVFGSKNPMMKLFTQFQVEVNNEFSTIFKDIPKGVHIPDREKKNMVKVAAWTLLRYFIGAYLFNDLYEKVVGRRAALDPLDILNDTVGDLTGKKLNNIVDMLSGEGFLEEREPANPSDAITETGKNVLEELPFVGGLLGGGRIPISSALPDAETIVKGLSNENWSASKKAQTVGRELGKTVGTYIMPPFAGGALKKAYQTAENTIAGGRFVKNAEGEDQIQYPYFTETPAETAGTVAKSLLFGPTATEGGREWVERGFGSQSAKNTALYRELTESGESQRASWDLILSLSGQDKQGKRETVAASGLTEEGKAYAMEQILNAGQSTEGTKFRAAYDNGVSADAWAALYGAMAQYDLNNNNQYTQAEIAEALENIRVPIGEDAGRTQGLFGGSTKDRALTNDEKAVLWSAYDPSWAPKNNPYSPEIGERVVARYSVLKGE